MIILFGLLLIVIGCCISASAEDDRMFEIEHERRHREVIKAVAENKSKQLKKSKVTRRRILKDTNGNVIAEEIIEETE